MSDPVWVDSELSAELPVLRANGEGQTLEFKREFPSNANKLAQEIAAFATSGGGTILLGVADDGALVGLPDMTVPKSRDSLLRRVEGLCNGPVRPAITPTARFAQEDGNTVLVVRIPKGSEPVYYCNNVPYVRHITTSRPAEPHEVIDLIRKATPVLAQAVQEGASAHSEILSRVAFILVDILIFASEIKERSINPWLGEMEAQLQYNAAELREFAATDEAVELGIVEQLRTLATQMDSVADFQHSLGSHSWNQFMEALKSLQADAEAFVRERLEEPGLLQEAAAQAKAQAAGIARQLDDLAARVEERAQAGRLKDIQEEASDLGNQILRLSYLGLQHAEGVPMPALRDAATRLHLVETQRVYADGGISFRAIQSAIRESSAQIVSALSDDPG